MVESDTPLQSCDSCGSPIDVSDCEPLTKVTCPVCGEPIIVGKVIGEYEILEVMGRGGMGVVYRARDTQLDRPVALKLLRRDTAQSGFLSELEAEAAITASINHPHVVKVYTTGSSAGRFYIAMELVDKGTLDELMDLSGRLPEAQALEVAVQIAQGLRAANQHGLIHRDIKPGNILFADAHTAKIVDFGLAIMEQASKGSDEIWGTPYYVSPERLDRKPEDFRSDIYSFGATMFHALAGRPPFEASDATMVAIKHLKSQAVSLQAFAPWVSNSTAYVINRTLHKDPAQRYQSYDEMIEHLEYAREEVMASAARPHEKKRVVLETAEDRKRVGLLTTVMVGLIALLLVGGGAFFFFRDRSEAPVGAVAKAIGAGGKRASDFEAARQLLLKGKPADAAEQFTALAAERRAPQPFLQWSLLQGGISWLHAGNLQKASEVFGQLRSQPYTSKEPGAGRLGDFFRQAAAIGTDTAKTPAATMKEVDGNSYTAFLLLIAGLKDWQLNQFDDSASLLRQFLSTAPGGGYVWITEYRPLSDDYLSDYSDYRGCMATVKSAKSFSELQGAVTTLRKVKADLRQPNGPLAVMLETAANEANAKVEEIQRKAAAQLETEKKVLTAARDKAAPLCRDWHFKEARDAVAAVSTSNPDLQREHRALLIKIQWLQRFRDKLVSDLAAGYPGPLKAKNGSPLTGAVTKASENGVELAAAGGAPVTKKWPELAPESILAMAESFVKADAPSWQTAERHWLAGVFAIMAGRKDDARKLLPEAARGLIEMADQLPILIPPKRSNVAKGKPTVSNDPNQASAAGNGPDKAVDGDPNTSWALAGPNPKWLRIDLGKEVRISRWLVRHASSHKDPAEGDTADFTLQRSNDDKAWADVDKVRNNTIGVTDRRVAAFSARYVRIFIEKPNRKPGGTDPIARLYEAEIYAADPANDPVGELFAAPQAAPMPELNSHDIGLAPTESTGQTSFDDRTGVFTLRAAGADIGANTDAFRFLHRNMNGDGYIVVRIESIDRATVNAKVGLMFREGTASDARMVYVCVGPQPGVLWQRRKEPKQMAATGNEPSISAPCWLKLQRVGNEFTASASTDGKNWKKIGTETIALPMNAEAGVAVCSHGTNANTNAKFEITELRRGK